MTRLRHLDFGACNNRVFTHPLCTFRTQKLQDFRIGSIISLLNSCLVIKCGKCDYLKYRLSVLQDRKSMSGSYRVVVSRNCFAETLWSFEIFYFKLSPLAKLVGVKCYKRKIILKKVYGHRTWLSIKCVNVNQKKCKLASISKCALFLVLLF